MINKSLKISSIIAAFILVFAFSCSMASAAESFGLKPIQLQLSSDGKTLYNGNLPVVYVVDPNPSLEPVRIPAPLFLRAPMAMATAIFFITYVADGDTDTWGYTCTTFPEEAKSAFNAAATIWANTIQSSVPITIRACWSSELPPDVLGGSGGGSLHSDFSGAPLPNTWYVASLANALYGSDLDPSNFDMHITYTSDNVTWYYGTDGATPSGQFDLMSVVLHEIAHGLNFSGTMSYSGGVGMWGYYTGYPGIYDRFMRDGTANPGNLLIDTGVYPNPSTALGSALTSNSIWFHGANAMAANGGQRVKMYAPASWTDVSSYAHLDYTTFDETINELMVYAISPGESVHDPGPVTEGLLTDLGWGWTAACGNLPVKVNSAYFNTIQAAYDNAADGDTIQIQAVEFNEDMVIDLNMTATLEGGYDCDYTADLGYATVNGSVTISDGVVTIENLVIQ